VRFSYKKNLNQEIDLPCLLVHLPFVELQQGSDRDSTSIAQMHLVSTLTPGSNLSGSIATSREEIIYLCQPYKLLLAHGKLGVVTI
jgi:hypothetical protein